MNHGIINLKMYGPIDDSKLLSKLKDYFSKRKSRNEYYVEMKQKAFELISKRKEKIIQEKIAEILCVNRVAIPHYKNTRKESKPWVKAAVEKYFFEWIEKGLYPTAPPTKEERADNPYYLLKFEDGEFVRI